MFQLVVLRRDEGTWYLMLLPSFTVAKGVFVVEKLFVVAKDSFVVVNPRLVLFS